MAMSIAKLQSVLLRDYYKYFSKFSRGKTPEQKVAWVTSFTPVEILEALGIYYCYPESYAAVIAASGKEQLFLDESIKCELSCDCCSYSCCIEGAISLEAGPRGTLPKPDVLIATNNQCSTLPNWWNILAAEFDVPLIVLDYPGERVKRETAFEYVKAQHKELVSRMEQLSGNHLDQLVLEQTISKSADSVAAWNRIIKLWPDHNVNPTSMFDDISFLITSRCKPETAELYNAIADELENEIVEDKSGIKLFWLGYPLWYHKDRYFSELLNGFSLVGSNYVTWWNLNYNGQNSDEKLFNAYNYTFLNLMQKTRNDMLSKCIEASGAECAVSLINKSCKCDFVSSKCIMIPQAEIEIDMIDRSFADIAKAKTKIELLRDAVCSK